MLRTKQANTKQTDVREEDESGHSSFQDPTECQMFLVSDTSRLTAGAEV